MMSARTTALAVLVFVVPACSKMDGTDSDISQSGSHNPNHVAGGGSMHLDAAEKGWHLIPYKCDDTERDLSMCGDGEPTHLSHLQTPAWLRDRPDVDVMRRHKMQ